MPKVQKERKTIAAYTAQFKIEGVIFTTPGERISDFISDAGEKKYIPVADAVVTDLTGRQICKSAFLELNVNEIVFLVPENKSE